MRHLNRCSIPLTTWALLSIAPLGCDVAEPADEELARAFDEDEDVDAEAAEGSMPAPADELTAPPDATAAANYFVPVGTDDLANCNTLEGWVKDGDTTAPTYVTVYRGAPFPYGQWVATAQANLYRSDLPFADKSHGYVINTPAALKTGYAEDVYVHGINIDVAGNWVNGATNPLLDDTGRTICCGQPCNGGGGGVDPQDPPY